MSKIVQLDSLRDILEKRGDKKVVFTNGCFDILHVGHIRFFKECKKEGDILIVGLNSDISVKRIKGFCRPIICQEDRAEILESIEHIDYIVIFETDTPESLIYFIKPDVLVKGTDWESEKIVGANFVEQNGGKIIRVPHTKPISTTNIIETILARFKDQCICKLIES